MTLERSLDSLTRELVELRESEKQFRAIAAFTYDWESWHGSNGRLRWVNNAVMRMTGFQAEECLAMDRYPLPIVVENDRARISEMLRQAAAGIPGNDVEFQFRMKDGRTRWGAISWQTITDDRGANMGFRTSVRDIADRKQMEQQIRDYAENLEKLVEERTARLMELEVRRAKVDRLAALGQLAAGIAHEVNNPLAGIRNAVELIHDIPGLNDEDRSLLDTVQSEIDRIGDIVRQLYQFHRPQPANETEVDLVRLVAQTIQLISGICRRHRVELNFRDSTAAPVLASVPQGELKQVLYNVILNAIQASSADSKVDVQIEVGDGQAAIRVTDYGSGISGDVLPKIFDPFFTTKHGGTQSGMGLGLSVSQSLMEAMGGQIQVESIPGSQTRFKLIVPRRSHNSV